MIKEYVCDGKTFTLSELIEYKAEKVVNRYVAKMWTGIIIGGIIGVFLNNLFNH